MVKDEDKLRDQHLSFYKEDIEKIDKLLENFLTLSKAKGIFLIDKSGNMITNKGDMKGFNPDELSALVAGSFAATKEMARLLGETSFSVMFHQGQKDNIHIAVIGEKAIAATIFDEGTTAGMISLYSKELAEKLVHLFEAIGKRKKRKEDMDLHENLGSSVQDKLDDLFQD